MPEMIARGFWYELFSVGPDGIQGSGVPTGQVKDKGTAMGTFYDPTNGTVSNGDIVRFGPGTSDYIAF